MPEFSLPQDKPKRYQILEGSMSCHCCFGFTIIDTAQPEKFHPEGKTMCECFDQFEADTICSALNEHHYGG